MFIGSPWVRLLGVKRLQRQISRQRSLRWQCDPPTARRAASCQSLRRGDRFVKETAPVEETLHALRYNRAATVRGTPADARIIDEWDTLDRLIDARLRRRFDDAERARRQSACFEEKFARAEALVTEWNSGAPQARLASLLES